MRNFILGLAIASLGWSMAINYTFSVGKVAYQQPNEFEAMYASAKPVNISKR